MSRRTRGASRFLRWSSVCTYHVDLVQVLLRVERNHSADAGYIARYTRRARVRLNFRTPYWWRRESSYTWSEPISTIEVRVHICRQPRYARRTRLPTALLTEVRVRAHAERALVIYGVAHGHSLSADTHWYNATLFSIYRDLYTRASGCTEYPQPA